MDVVAADPETPSRPRAGAPHLAGLVRGGPSGRLRPKPQRADSCAGKASVRTHHQKMLDACHRVGNCLGEGSRAHHANVALRDSAAAGSRCSAGGKDMTALRFNSLFMLARCAL
jgi:hypothetical protein